MAILLNKSDFIYINKATLDAHGGNLVAPNNFLNEPALDYLLEAVDSKIFRQEAYPSIASKAAVYMFNTISNHIFQDGNKRTGLAAMQLFLDINGYRLSPTLSSIQYDGRAIPASGSTSNEILFEFVMEVASGTVPFEACVTWIERNSIPIEHF